MKYLPDYQRALLQMLSVFFPERMLEKGRACFSDTLV